MGRPEGTKNKRFDRDFKVSASSFSSLKQISYQNINSWYNGAMVKRINRSGSFFAYIVECADGTYYTGYTNDLEKRIKEHNGRSRGAKYTRGRGPVKLVWQKGYRYLKRAMQTEMMIKQLTRKQKRLLAGGMRLDKVLEKAKI